MENASVVLDTNAYRYLASNLSQKETKKLVDKINTLEEERDIVSFTSHVVAAELLSHLNDNNDPHYTNCRNAANALFHHNINDDNGNLRFVADSESELCRILFERESPHWEELTAQQNHLLYEIYNKSEDEELSHISDHLNEISQRVEQSEKQFVKDMWNYVVKTAKSDAKDWDDVRDDSDAREEAMKYLRSADQELNTAKGLVIKTMNILNIKQTQEVINDKARYLSKIFDAHIKLYSQILEKILLGGANVENKSRPNWIWDLQLSFYIGEESSIDGRKTYLITSDGEILKAAEEANSSDYVFELNEYLQMIGF
ncbi:hypothetical protein [Fodinibius salsisoli]|uniref:PIN domain-containing protein n=1 Tax=Fodinibius salsisoli TaxID=2820877 RepID=A0ABT3PKR0_9BACT|nr:hypothetical protein [Fodinibius salsisoli]MCW9706531.1 hypothetical protein [Fodinibius salsisoli]